MVPGQHRLQETFAWDLEVKVKRQLFGNALKFGAERQALWQTTHIVTGLLAHLAGMGGTQTCTSSSFSPWLLVSLTYNDFRNTGHSGSSQHRLLHQLPRDLISLMNLLFCATQSRFLLWLKSDWYACKWGFHVEVTFCRRTGRLPTFVLLQIISLNQTRWFHPFFQGSLQRWAKLNQFKPTKCNEKLAWGFWKWKVCPSHPTRNKH